LDNLTRVDDQVLFFILLETDLTNQIVLFAYIPNVEDLLPYRCHQPIKIKKVSFLTYSESHVRPAKIESPDSGTLSSPQKIQMISLD
jgi:hypothetical protein